MVLNNIWNNFWSCWKGQLIKVVVTAAVAQEDLEFFTTWTKMGESRIKSQFGFAALSLVNNIWPVPGNPVCRKLFRELTFLPNPASSRLEGSCEHHRHTDSKCRNQAQTSWIIKKLIRSVFVTWFLCSINKGLNLNNWRCEQLQSLLKRNKSFVTQHCSQAETLETGNKDL